MTWQVGCETIVVVPCYNEAQRLDFAAFGTFLGGCQGSSLLFVDDGSTDSTAVLLEQFTAQHSGRASVLRLKRNAGKAEAVRLGMLHAWRRSPTFVGYWDADLATPLATVKQFRELLTRRPELSLAMGSRIALLGREINRRWVRHLAGRAFATAASLTLGLAVYDTQCGAKLFRATPEIELLFRQPFRSRWVFDVEILARLVAVAGKEQAEHLIYECPLDRWTDVGGSQLSLRDFARASMDLARIYWHDIRGRASKVPAASIGSKVEHPPRRKAA
ncbi:MAG TPA: glycosyltransferase [Lacipirellulaceae bacterium]